MRVTIGMQRKGAGRRNQTGSTCAGTVAARSDFHAPSLGSKPSKRTRVAYINKVLKCENVISGF